MNAHALTPGERAVADRPPDSETYPEGSDSDNALLFRDLHGAHVRYVSAWGREVGWVAWSEISARWVPGSAPLVKRWAMDVARAQGKAAAALFGVNEEERKRKLRAAERAASNGSGSAPAVPQTAPSTAPAPDDFRAKVAVLADLQRQGILTAEAFAAAVGALAGK